MPTSIVDSHVHVWADGSDFSKPRHGEVATPLSDASVAALLDAMRVEQVSAAVLVQYIGYRWGNEYVAQAIAARPDLFAGVCRVDPEDPDAADHLSNWTENHGFQGVRLGPATQSRENWLAGAVIDPLFARASALGVPVLMLMSPQNLRELMHVLDRHPEVDVVIDHLADCNAANPDHRQLLQELSTYPKAYLKTGHIWANSAQAYPWRDKHAEIKLARDLFGASRLMWGSDWSFSLNHGSYHQTVSYLQEEAGFLNSKELDWIMGGTARRLWHFSAPLNRATEPQLQGGAGQAQHVTKG